MAGISGGRNLLQTASDSAADRKVLETDESLHASGGVVREMTQAMHASGSACRSSTAVAVTVPQGIIPSSFVLILFTAACLVLLVRPFIVTCVCVGMNCLSVFWTFYRERKS